MATELRHIQVSEDASRVERSPRMSRSWPRDLTRGLLRRDLLQIGRKVAPVTLGRVFGRLWAGSTAANMADGIAFVAFPWWQPR